MPDQDEDFVEVYATPEDAQETARALLDAADSAGLPVDVVESLGGGGFRVPKDVADKAALPKGVNVDTDEVEAPKRGGRRHPRPTKAPAS